MHKVPARMGLRSWGLALPAALLGSALLTPVLGFGSDVDTIPAVGEPGGPHSAMTPEQAEQFLRGRRMFDHRFHKSDGLGLPDFNADSCRACHQDPVMGGAGGLELNVSRFGRDLGNPANFVNLPGGQVASKLRPPFPGSMGEREEIFQSADVFEQRQTPTVLGIGLINTIPDIVILSNEDPTDQDGDGIFGVARLLQVGPNVEVGRFGWKAQIPFVADFVHDAMAGECGITTPDHGRPFATLTDNDNVPDPELSQEQFDDILFWMVMLAPPKRGGSTDPQLPIGEALFDSVGCAKCHVPVLQGAEPVPLYSNLLLHNVMPAGFHGMSETGAGVGFYRTPPLWGIRDTAPYMHDGRAETIEEAILAHDGEAATVRANYQALLQADKDALLHFLNDL